MAKDTNNLCKDGGDMLGYLFNEMAEAERDRFDLHLAECGQCVDEFAALSQAHYPVYEWKQIEFEPMATPLIVLPSAKVSLFDKVRAAFAFRPGFAAAGVAAAILLTAVAGLAWFGLKGGSNDVAVAENPKPEPSPVRKVEQPVVFTPKEDEVAAADSRPKVEEPIVREVKPAKAKADRPVVKEAKIVTPARRNVPMPRLAEFKDDEDDSLRLAEMFNDIDTEKSRL